LPRTTSLRITSSARGAEQGPLLGPSHHRAVPRRTRAGWFKAGDRCCLCRSRIGRQEVATAGPCLSHGTRSSGPIRLSGGALGSFDFAVAPLYPLRRAPVADVFRWVARAIAVASMHYRSSGPQAHRCGSVLLPQRASCVPPEIFYAPVPGGVMVVAEEAEPAWSRTSTCSRIDDVVRWSHSDPTFKPLGIDGETADTSSVEGQSRIAATPIVGSGAAVLIVIR